MDVSVDPEKCQGHARCNLIAPVVFDLDEGGYSIVVAERVPADFEAAVLNAIANCPERAISIS